MAVLWTRRGGPGKIVGLPKPRRRTRQRRGADLGRDIASGRFVDVVRHEAGTPGGIAPGAPRFSLRAGSARVAGGGRPRRAGPAAVDGPHLPAGAGPGLRHRGRPAPARVGMGTRKPARTSKTGAWIVTGLPRPVWAAVREPPRGRGSGPARARARRGSTRETTNQDGSVRAGSGRDAQVSSHLCSVPLGFRAAATKPGSGQDCTPASARRR